MQRRLLDTTGIAPTAWRWAWAGALIGLVLAMLAFAPARWLAALVQQASSGHVLLSQCPGAARRADLAT